MSVKSNRPVELGHVDDIELSKIEQGHHDLFASDDHHEEHPSKIMFKWPSSFDFGAISQRLLAELIGTYFLVFLGCGAIVMETTKGQVTYVGICVTWGLVIMIIVYAFEHISAHFNPAVTITFAVLRNFPWKEVPFYIIAQIVGSTLASASLNLLLDDTPKSYFGTLPSGTDVQALFMEIIISFILGFVLLSIAFDERAHREFAGAVLGMTILINALVAGEISGASMNPARSLGPAIVRHQFKSIWVYMLGPTLGILAGGSAYNFIKYLNQLPLAYHDHKLPFQRLYHH